MWSNARQLNRLAGALYGLVVLLLCGAAGYWTVQQPFFVLRTIHIGGDVEHLNAPTIRAALTGHLEGNFFTVNLSEIRTAIQSMPWIRNSSIRRVWPNQLAIVLEEYKPLGLWKNDQLVSQEGELFTANPEEAGDHLPLLGGPAGSEKEVVMRYRDFSQWLAPLGLTVRSVTLSPRYAWTVELSTGLRLELGLERNANTLAERFERFIAAWPEISKQWGEQIEAVDLRYPNGLALRKANPSAQKTTPSAR